MLQALFEGRRELFSGLYIEPLWDWSRKWPVLRLDFGSVQPDRAEDLEESRRLLKTMRDSLGEIVEGFRPFVANVRELLRLERTRFISGRPRKRGPPDPAAFLPGFGP